MEQSIIVDALTKHARPALNGWFVGEEDLPFITVQLGRAVEARKFDGLITYLNRLDGWSQVTFGPESRTLGFLDHIRKELVEIEAKPDDLEEWIDVLTLTFNGAMRRGFTAWQIIKMLLFKLDKNQNRKWPDWRTADPVKGIEHIR
jgi:hypothetical protein